MESRFIELLEGGSEFDRIAAYRNELMRPLHMEEIKALRNLCEKVYDDGFEDGINEGVE